MEIENSHLFSRRNFILAAMGSVTLPLLSRIHAADEPGVHSSPSNPSLLINQETFSSLINSPSTLTETIRVCRDVWKLSGFELSLDELNRISQGNLDAFLGELKSEMTQISQTGNCENFKLALSVDGSDPEKTMLAVSKVSNAVELSWCSVTLPDVKTGESLVRQLSEWVASVGVKKCETTPRVMLETPRITSGMEVRRLARLLEPANPEIGVLLRSNTTLYRFDVALQDLTLSLDHDAGSNNSKRYIAARINVNVDRQQSPMQVAFDREMYHRAISGYSRKDSKIKPDFVSLRSSEPLSMRTGDSSQQMTIDNTIFSEALTVARRDLNAA